mmetsp:Transcript_15450/g.38440  ORF Transcript_15450/g.38440 Transcript_15450/m.38440 type:complete len:886 (+) Transcript_15450:399-3056(+)
MYRTILKEIGVNAGSVDYLFDSDGGDDDDNNFSLLDSSSDEESTARKESTTTNNNTDKLVTPQQQQQQQHRSSDKISSVSKLQFFTLSDNDGSSSDESLLHEWANEWQHEPALNAIVGSAVKEAAKNAPEEVEEDKQPSASPSSIPEWKEKLQSTQIQQQQLQQQFLHLQETQRRSSPSHTTVASSTVSPPPNTTKSRIEDQNGIHETPLQVDSALSVGSSIENYDPIQPPVTVAVAESDAPTTTEVISNSSSPVLQQIDERNTELEKNWAEQQVEAAQLQNKLKTLKLQFKDEQRVWKEDKSLLFSPVRGHATAENKNKSDSTDKSTATVKATGIKSPAKRNVYPSSLPGPTTPSSLSKTPACSSKKKASSATKQVAMMQPDDHHSNMNEDDPKDLIGEKQRLQQLVDEYKAKLEQKESDLDALETKYGTEKQEWESLSKKNQQAQDELAQDLENAKQKLQDQVTVNQDLREELQELKSSGWKDQLEAAQTKINDAVEQQARKEEEFQAKIQALDGKHEAEREQWQKQLSEYEDRLEENTCLWEEHLQVEKDRYKELQEKHEREIMEWEALLEKEMEDAQANDMIKNFDEVLPPSSSSIVRSNDASLDYSSVQDKSQTSESMERIDCLLEELGRMGDEREAVLKDITAKEKGQSNHLSTNDDEGINTEDNEDGEVPKPVESPPGSIAGVDDDHHRSNTGRGTDDSAMLDQTLNLLHNLRDMMENDGNVFDQEASVLETLENLSGLMQDESGRARSIVLSPGRNLSAMSDAFSQDDEHENEMTPASPVKLASDSLDPWPALVAELRSRIAFLEHDRAEVIRVTELIMQKDRESHKLKLEAAVATAIREVEEKLHQCQLETANTIRGLYRGLCPTCQSQVKQSLQL